MEFVLSIIASLVALTGGLLGPDDNIAQSVAAPQSVEFGLSEVSPKGASGGFAMPASGCSAAAPDWHGAPIHDCAVFPDISVDKPIIRLGDSVDVSWDPRTHTNCVLSSNVMDLSPVPDGNIAGSRTDTPTGETSYSISCDGAGNEDSATVKVLPRIQET